MRKKNITQNVEIKLKVDIEIKSLNYEKKKKRDIVKEIVSC